MPDINQLLMREQIERTRAERAACDATRAAHETLADGYRAMIDDHRRGRIIAAAPRVTPHA
ncbi:MAG: hypothetical protein ACXWUP_06665 [Allosphingosinicella sp.]